MGYHLERMSSYERDRLVVSNLSSASVRSREERENSLFISKKCFLSRKFHSNFPHLLLISFPRQSKKAPKLPKLYQPSRSPPPPLIQVFPTTFFLSHMLYDSFHYIHFSGAFDEDDVTHVEGEVNPVRDLDIISDELRLKDIEQLNGAIEKIEKNALRSNDKKLKEEYVSRSAKSDCFLLMIDDWWLIVTLHKFRTSCWRLGNSWRRKKGISDFRNGMHMRYVLCPVCWWLKFFISFYFCIWNGGDRSKSSTSICSSQPSRSYTWLTCQKRTTLGKRTSGKVSQVSQCQSAFLFLEKERCNHTLDLLSLRKVSQMLERMAGIWSVRRDASF